MNNRFFHIIVVAFGGIIIPLSLPNMVSVLTSLASPLASNSPSSGLNIPNGFIHEISIGMVLFSVAIIIFEIILAIKDAFSNSNSGSSNSYSYVNNNAYSQQSPNSENEQNNISDEEYIDPDKDLKNNIKENFNVNAEDILQEKDHTNKIKEILGKAEKAISKNNIDDALTHIVNSIKIAYLADAIKDNFLDKIDKKIEKIQLLLNLANGTTYGGEKETSIKKSIELCKSTINLIKGEIYGTEQFSAN